MGNKEKTKIGVGYIRESTEEQDKGFSPENQKRNIEKYAKDHNIKTIRFYKDLVSGKSENRPEFQQMIADAKKKEFEVILIYHTSRFARNVKDARHYKELLRKKLGIDVVSITQNFGDDFNNPSAFLNEGINELFDEHYSKQLSFWVRSGCTEKRRQGFQLGNPPLGYFKKVIGYDEERKRTIYSKNWDVDEEEAKLVKKIFEMYSSGNYSYLQVAMEINKSGIKTKYKNAFTYTSIKDILKNQTYLGYVYSPRNNYPTAEGNHKPIISEDLFYKVQEIIKERRGTKGRPVAQHRFYLLQGLLYCYNCFDHMKGKENNPSAKMTPKMYCHTSVNGKKEHLMYACKFRKETGECNQPSVDVEIIDKQVLKFMEGFNIPDDVIKMTLEKLQELFKKPVEVSDESNKVKILESRKKKLNFQYLNTEELSEQEYLKELGEINADLKKYGNLGVMSESDFKSKSKEYIKQTEKFLLDFKKFWNGIDNEEKRAWIQMTIKRVWVKDKKVVAIEPKDDYKALFSIQKKVLGQSPSITPIL